MNTDGTFGQPTILGFLYDINFAWNFGNRGVFGGHINPYLVFGGGGLTAEVRHGSSHRKNSQRLAGHGSMPKRRLRIRRNLKNTGSTSGQYSGCAESAGD
jgi:hypothetical protein